MEELYIKGQPDSFEIYSGNTLIGYCDDYDEAALPFYLSDGKVYYGKNGDEHRSIGYDIIGVSPEYIFRLNDSDEIEKYERMRDAAANKVRWGKNALPGRIWTRINAIKKIKLPFNFSVMSFWGSNNEINEKIDSNLIRQIIDYVGVNENNLFITKYDDGKYDEGKLVRYVDWDFYIPKMSDAQKDIYAIHLMKSQDKRDATADFRNTRDRLIGKKLTNSKGVEMPLAQYKSMLSVESKKRQDSIIKEVINQYLKQKT